MAIEAGIASPVETQPAVAKRPLCVDLDDALLRSDLTLECLLGAVKRSPWLLPQMLLWRMAGTHRLAHELAARSDVDVSVLPYERSVLQAVSQARAEGRPTVLIAGSHRKYAERIAQHLGLFDEVYASDETVHLTRNNRSARLIELFGDAPFDYVTSAPVTPSVHGAAGTVESSAAPFPVNPTSDDERSRARGPIASWLKAMRIHQWAKNALLFVPLITAHAFFDVAALLNVVAAFFSFGLCASATYIVNDLLDLDADRHHRKKKWRPFASGALSVRSGLLGCAAMLATGAGIALALPDAFQLALLAYVVVTFLYSFLLKRVASLDVITLAGLYTLRVIAGAFAAGVALSFWLLAFSMFVFLCLAFVKRVAELLDLRSKQQLESVISGKARGREYSVEDIPILQTLGAASGYLAVLVLALYIHSQDVSTLYASPEVLWLIAPLMLLWVTRLWIVTTRGYMDEDPILFAVKDPETWITAAITATILVVATVWSF